MYEAYGGWMADGWRGGGCDEVDTTGLEVSTLQRRPRPTTACTVFTSNKGVTLCRDGGWNDDDDETPTPAAAAAAATAATTAADVSEEVAVRGGGGGGGDAGDGGSDKRRE